MKKDFQKASGLLSKVALVLVVVSSAQIFANQTEGLQAEVPAQGRATLTTEDLQTLLGIKTRDPSSSEEQMQEQEALASAPTFDVKISGEEKARIAKALSKVSVERAKLAQKLEEQKAAQVKELRKQRRNIQISRTRSSNDTTALGQNLFTSLLAEANAEAGVDSALNNFDQNNAVEIQFVVKSDGSREILVIKLGAEFVWNQNASNSMLATR